MGDGYLDEEQPFISVWELSKAAISMQEALKMEWEREEYFKSLYEDISFGVARYGDPEEDFYFKNISVEGRAIEIIDAKTAYDKKISRLKEKHSRWQEFLRLLDIQEANLLQNHFEYGLSVSDHELNQILENAVRAWEEMDYARSRILDDKASKQYIAFRKQYPELFKRKREKFPYLIDGEIKQMSRTDYEMYMRKNSNQSNSFKPNILKRPRYFYNFSDSNNSQMRLT